MSTPLFSNLAFSDGVSNTSKKGFVPQWKEIPIASKKTANKVVQYIGPSNDEFEHGYFYYCEVNEDTPGVIVYDWVRINVQPTGGTPTPVSYMDLEHHPSINSIALEGNKTHTDLGLVSAEEVAQDFEDVHDLIDDVAGNSVIDIERATGDSLGIDVKYGNSEATIENVDLSHTHSQYLVQADLNEYATTQEVATYLEDKAQKNLSNVTGGYDWVVVDNRTSNYRTWRNRYTECRGIATTVATSEGVEITLPLAYTDTNYIVSLDVRSAGNYFVSYSISGVQKFSVYIRDYYGNPVAVPFSWKSEGYVY